MPLGNNYDNNKKTTTVYDPSVYSPYKMNNAEGSIDQTCLSFTFWNNSLKISIAPRKQTSGNDGQVYFDYDNGTSIYLNHSKARIFAEELKLFITDPIRYNNSGVPSGQGLITVSNGVEFGSESPVIVIRKISETGETISAFAYQTKGDYYFSVRNFKEDGSFEKDTESYKYFEILQLITILEEFYKASTCAVAYTVIDQLKYEHTRQRNLLQTISNKLGIEGNNNSNSNGRRYNSNSYFNSSSGVNNNPNTASEYNGPINNGYTQATLDDIM